jgi:hypothetical protein
MSYPEPRQFAMLKGFAECEGISVSQAVNIILKEYFNRLPERKVRKYRAAYNPQIAALKNKPTTGSVAMNP